MKTCLRISSPEFRPRIREPPVLDTRLKSPILDYLSLGSPELTIVTSCRRDESASVS